MALTDTIVELSKRLFPKGFAFKMPKNGYSERLLSALSIEEAAAYTAMLSTLNSILPNNDNFTADDATRMEAWLGIKTNTALSLADRKAAITRKLNHPGNSPARNSALFIQSQLQLAGFDVYVYENRFYEGSPPEWITKTPSEILSDTVGAAYYDGFSYGDAYYGGDWSDEGISIVVSHLEEDLDASWVTATNWRRTFFIAGSSITTFADVDEYRKIEFRELICKLKPVQTVGILFVNYA